MKAEWHIVIKTGVILLLVGMVFVIWLQNPANDDRINERLFNPNTDKTDVSGKAIERAGKRDHERIVQLMEISCEEAWIYWDGVLKHDKEKEELDYLVDWVKDKQYLEGLWIDERGIDTLPRNKKTRKRIQEEEGFDRVKEYMKETKYGVVNYWSSENRVTVMHEFQLEEIQGNYCLDYIGGKLSENKKENYRKVGEKFYSHVIYYK